MATVSHTLYAVTLTMATVAHARCELILNIATVPRALTDLLLIRLATVSRALYTLSCGEVRASLCLLSHIVLLSQPERLLHFRLERS